MIKAALITLIRIYQSSLSLLLGETCRFYPSCSEYTLKAIEVHGSVRGIAMGITRICKCHPFHPGGIDPIPTKHKPETEATQKARVHGH